MSRRLENLLEASSAGKFLNSSPDVLCLICDPIRPRKEVYRAYESDRQPSHGRVRIGQS